MASSPRVVAELGRPETPDETAARKAASSHAYRSSQTMRNLLVALLVTLAVVLIVVLGVPRGAYDEQGEIDVAASAQAAAGSTGTELLIPEVPDSWRANSARMEGAMWRVVYAPSEEPEFIRVAQLIAADAPAASRLLGGATPTGTVTIDGIEWDEFTVTASDDNVSYAIATPAGSDTIVIYGSAPADTAATAAAGVADQIRELREENQ
ncbi:DUF4245 family protein [Microbacterium invictum]|uniref:DUF4245 domain-containing protein n=1 Tax=Microbacterium invictum TaxID=515415 RepID=A0AA40VLK9_9MICO|nr:MULTISPECIES: DUF4245 family protein [Microbacterium]MBB4138709.1 hypothetical protein [Microbacterium invictum]